MSIPWVQVAKDKKGFVLEPSGKPFIPWGFNYDHDAEGRLIEDYWDEEWAKVEAHFGQMKKLGANVVRIHLQVGKFMDAPDKPNEKALDRLAKLLAPGREGTPLPRSDRPGLLPQEGRAGLVRQARREGSLGRAGPLLGGRGGPVRKKPGRLLLRPDERAGRARRQTEGRRLAGPAFRRQALRPVHHPGPAGPAPARHRPPVGSPPDRRHPASRTSGT